MGPPIGKAPEEFKQLDASCEAFDREISVQVDPEALKALAATLKRRYVADPSRMAAYAGCGVFHGPQQLLPSPSL